MQIYRGLCLVTCLVAFAPDRAPAQERDAAPPEPVRCAVDPAWPQKPASCAWGAVSGIAVDTHDRVYVFHRGEPTVQVYEPDGTLVRTWSTGNPEGTHHIRLDPEGNVWVADFRAHIVQKYSPLGAVILTLGEAGQPGCDERHFDGPTDMAFLPNGDIFVSDGYGNRRIVHFDKQGRFIKAWGEDGTGPGQFALPHAVAFDSQQRLYVADRNNARIQVFDTEGQLLAVWDDLIMPWGCVVTGNDELWVCGSSAVKQPGGEGWVITPPPDQVLMKLSTAGDVLLRVPLDTPVAAPGQPGAVDWVHAVAVDSQGNIYLGDIQGRRAQKFSLCKP